MIACPWAPVKTKLQSKIPQRDVNRELNQVIGNQVYEKSTQKQFQNFILDDGDFCEQEAEVKGTRQTKQRERNPGATNEWGWISGLSFHDDASTQKNYGSYLRGDRAMVLNLPSAAAL